MAPEWGQMGTGMANSEAVETRADAEIAPRRGCNGQQAAGNGFVAISLYLFYVASELYFNTDEFFNKFIVFCNIMSISSIDMSNA
jgi:hypothetical protein